MTPYLTIPPTSDVSVHHLAPLSPAFIDERAGLDRLAALADHPRRCERCQRFLPRSAPCPACPPEVDTPSVVQG